MFVGQQALVARFDLQVALSVKSSIGKSLRTTVQNGRVEQIFTRRYQPADTIAGHLRFALRYEPIHMGVLERLFSTIDHAGRDIEQWVSNEPTGAYARRSWFLYEFLTGQTLDLPDVTSGQYVDAIDSDLQFTAPSKQSKRHRVSDNILGVPGFAPLVRKTEEIRALHARNVQAEANALVEGCDPDILARAINYLYVKETRSSYAIEHDDKSPDRQERFVRALISTIEFGASDKSQIVALQNLIVEPRYRNADFRTFQNYVGEMLGGYTERIHFICPRPQDVVSMMNDWMRLSERLKGADPVVAAAVIAFGFVFVHPFEDGNGRIHRYLIHHVLSREGFTPGGILFPVSASILRDPKLYDAALETVSSTVMDVAEWQRTADGGIVVGNDTGFLYRYFDGTRLAEFLHEKMLDTVRVDLREQLTFMAIHSRLSDAVRSVVDMPDKRLSLMVMLLMQNKGRLSATKRGQFAEITDHELARMEALATDVIGVETTARQPRETT